MAQSASLISEMLVEKSQFAIAHELIDESLKKMRLNENKAALWKIQAYVFKSGRQFRSGFGMLAEGHRSRKGEEQLKAAANYTNSTKFRSECV